MSQIRSSTAEALYLAIQTKDIDYDEEMEQILLETEWSVSVFLPLPHKYGSHPSRSTAGVDELNDKVDRVLAALGHKSDTAI